MGEVAAVSEKVATGEGLARKEFIHETPKVIYDLVDQKAIALVPDLKEAPAKGVEFRRDYLSPLVPVYKVDFEKGQAIVEAVQPKNDLSQVDLGSDQELLDRARLALRDSIVALVRRGDLPAELVAQVGRLLKPSDTKVTKGDIFRFVDFGRSFPAEKGDRGTFEVGRAYVEGWFGTIKGYLEERGISATDEQVLNVVMRNGASHEYGHAVDKTLRILAWESAEKSRGHQLSISEGAAVDDAYNEVIYRDIVPNQEIAALLEKENPKDSFGDYQRTNSERISSGFEALGTQYALEETGLKSEDVDFVLGKIAAADQVALREFKTVLDKIYNSHLNLAIVATAVGKLKNYLVKEDRNDLVERIGLSLSSRDLGYYFPLTKDEVHKYINYFWKGEEKKNDQ